MIKIIYNFAAEEGYAIFKSWFVDDHGSTFGFNSFHDALGAALTEVHNCEYYHKAKTCIPAGRKLILIYTHIAICHGKCYFNYKRKNYGYAVKKSGMFRKFWVRN